MSEGFEVNCLYVLYRVFSYPCKNNDGFLRLNKRVIGMMRVFWFS